MVDATEQMSPTRLNADLCELDTVFDLVATKRRVIVEKLETHIAEMTIDTENPRTAEVQMQIVNTYLSSLKSMESAITGRATMKLKQNEGETASAHSQAVAELLSRIDSGSIRFGNASPTTASQKDEDIERVFAESGLAPIADTELKTDPHDVAA